MSENEVSPEFIAEAQEIVDALNRDLIAVEKAIRDEGEVDPDLVNTLFRSAHSLKGISGMFGLEEIAGLSHEMESVLDGMRLGRVEVDASALDVLFSCVDRFGILIEEAAVGEIGDGSGSKPLIEQLKRAASGETEAKEEDLLETVELGDEVISVLTEYEEHRLRENIKKGKTLYILQTAFDLATFDEGLAELDEKIKGNGEVITKLPSSKEVEPGKLGFDIIVGSKFANAEFIANAKLEEVDVVEVARKSGAAPIAPPVAPVAPVAPTPEPAAVDTAATEPSGTDTSVAIDVEGKPGAPEKAKKSAAENRPRSTTQTVRVDIRRLDRLMNLVGELALTKISVQRISEKFKQTIGFTGLAVDLHKESRNFERRLQELQSGIMDVRMVPLENLFERMVRIGRQMGRELGRRVRIEVIGAHTELDKLIVEDLADPLMHLIRNAIDHGLENPEDRIASGKDEEGVVRLTAIAQGNHVLVQISDDGLGVNTVKVLERAVSRGLITQERAAEMKPREVFNLLFKPGFSTAETVTEFSGRGVGMDVVKNNISELSGIIDIESEPGRGTTFTITLPITLAIIPALIVKMTGTIYALPLNNVMETLALEEVEIKTIELREVISVRGLTVPLIDLREIFGLVGERGASAFAVVAGVGESRMALVVDELIGQQDIVIKSLGRRLRNVPGIAGATELGNQQTILVIDMVGLLGEIASGSAERINPGL